MSGWTTIPPWLYQNDLPDEELQDVYVKAAARKVAELLDRRDQHDRYSKRWRDLDFMARQAQDFLGEAMNARDRYRRRRRGP